MIALAVFAFIVYLLLILRFDNHYFKDTVSMFIGLGKYKSNKTNIDVGVASD